MVRLADPAEQTAAYRAVVADVDRAATAAAEALGSRAGTRGFCHRFWREKKALLASAHGIAWQTPAEMNPGWRFD